VDQLVELKWIELARFELVEPVSGSPAAHYGPLAQLWPAYDCSGAVSYLLYKIGALPAAEDSGELESWGQPGPGKWITVYVSGPHTWIVVAGIAFDTSATGQTVAGIPAGSGPRWRTDPTGNLGDGYSYVQRHPAGL
jgi:hypothetical protein